MKAEHLHIGFGYLYTDDQNQDDFFVLSKDKRGKIGLRNMRYAHLSGDTKGIHEFYSAIGGKKKREMGNSRLSLQDSGYTACGLDTRNGLVFPSFKVLDEKALAFYNKKQEEKRKIDEELQKYFNDRFKDLYELDLYKLIDYAKKGDRWREEWDVRLKKILKDLGVEE